MVSIKKEGLNRKKNTLEEENGNKEKVWDENCETGKWKFMFDRKLYFILRLYVHSLFYRVFQSNI